METTLVDLRLPLGGVLLNACWSSRSYQVFNTGKPSLIPSRAMLYLCISGVICAAFPLWNIVLTFHVPMVVSLKRERRCRPAASRYLKLFSPLDFILLLTEDLSKSSRSSSLVGVSVAKLVFRGEKAGLTSNPGGPECFFLWPLSHRPIRHVWTCQEYKAPAGTALGIAGARKLPRHNKAKHQEKRKPPRRFIRYFTMNTLQLRLSIKQRIPPNLAIDTLCAKMVSLTEMHGWQITNSK